jgi:predicted DsbA family dithiol-disulfide isomerase
MMHIEIWSDVLCPFCYIGKRHLESALAQFPHSDQVQVSWRAYQLQPGITPDPTKSLYEHLAETKGWSLEQSQQAHDHVTRMARAAGLSYNFDHAIPANSLNAHRLAHMAAHHDREDAATEALFKAYFVEGRNIDDTETLVAIGTEIGLNPADVRTMLAGDAYKQDVQSQIDEARHIGVQGVPFFVLDRKYAISGAQPVAQFLAALNQTWQESHPQTLRSPDPAPTESATAEGDLSASCDIDGNGD